MFKRLFEQRKYLSAITAGILVIQTFLPSVWTVPEVFAAETYTMEFADGTGLTLDSGLTTFDYDGSASGVLHFKVTPDDSGMGTGLPVGDISISMAYVENQLWAVQAAGTLYYSDDAGENWVSVDPNPGPIKIFEEVIGVGGDDLVVGGSEGGVTGLYYSADNGTSWNSSVIPGGFLQTIVAMTYDAANDKVYAAGNTGAVLVSADNGANWSEVKLVPTADDITGPTDIVCFGSNSIALIGTSVGGATINFTLTGADPWSVGANPVGAGSGFYTNGYFYAYQIGNSSLTRISTSDQMDNAGDWSDISGNLAAYVPWRVQSMISHPSSTGVIFAILKTAPGYELISTINDGGHWLSHASVLGVNADWIRSPMAINATTPSSLLIGGQDIATTNSTIWSADFNPANTSILIDTGITELGKITSITPAYHSQKIGTIGIAFSSDNTDWYYYSGTWQHSAADDSAFSTDIDTLTAEILDSLPISGNLYIKLYNQTGAGLTLMDSLTLTYTENEGDDPGDYNILDQTKPVSAVDALPAFSTTPDRCDPVLTVTASATDELSGVSSLTLYASTDGGQSFAPWEGADNPATFSPKHLSVTASWDVPVQHGDEWRFYSIAKDYGNTIENPNTELPPAGADAITVIDIVAPKVGDSDPYDQQGIIDSNFVGITNPIVFWFSEPLVPETFEYEFYRADDEQKTPIGGTVVEWGADDSRVTITHTALDYSIAHIFDITKATDRAGNELNDLILCPCDGGGFYPPGGNPNRCYWSIQPPPPRVIRFMTQERMDPDLLASKIEVADGPNDDKSYNAGDEAQFTVTLINSSSFAAENVAVKFDVPEGLVYVKTDSDGGGTITETKDGSGKVVSLVWRNKDPVIKDRPVEIKFTMQVNSPALVFSITQNIKIYDNVNFIEDDSPLGRSATLQIARNPQFTASSKIVKFVDGLIPELNENGQPLAQPNSVVTYEVTIKNTGTTIGDVEFSDFVPSKDNNVEPPIYFQPGSIEYAGDWDTAPYYDSQSVQGTAKDVLPNSGSLVLTFNAIVRGDITEEMDITNSAYVWDPNITPFQQVQLSATVHVPGGPVPPLEVIYQSPAPNSVNNGLKSKIEAGFNKPIDLEQPFEYSVIEGGTELTAEELEDWNPTWEDGDTMFVLVPPDNDEYGGELLIGAVYEITIISATAATEEAEMLEEPVTWQFTTADPMLTITTPAAPLYELKINTRSEKFTVKLTDSISGEPYKTEEDIDIGLKAFLGDTICGSGIFFNANNNQLGADAKITIAKNGSVGYFYYQDSAATPEGSYITILAYENPYRGWIDGIKYVVVTDTEQPLDGLHISIPSTTLTVGKMSNAITIWATNEAGTPIYLPEGKLYLYTTSDAGNFYNSDQERLPGLQTDSTEGLTIQGIGDEAQFIDIGADTSSLILFYASNATGVQQITVSDNQPQLPDIGFNDASAVLNIQKALEEEELLEELEEVVDDTGRVIDRMVIKPAEVSLLPGKTQLFKATAYDTKGKPIDNAKFKWFVLIDKSGAINKNGDDETTHQSTFAAGEELGTYYDTVLVATLYNGKIAYATASVAVVDVVDYRGPKRLPITGMNGLQLVLLGLTLAAAVALAWVEHYDKTHFQKSES